MFFTYFKQSAKALPWLILPVLVCVFYTYYLDPKFIQIYSWAEGNTHGEWIATSNNGVGIKYMSIGMGIAFLVNLLFLIIIPCAIGGTNPVAKRTEFYMGFFITLAFSLAVPFFWQNWFVFDPKTFSILLTHCVIGFLVTFILGSLFVSKAYAGSFWFWNRG